VLLNRVAGSEKIFYDRVGSIKNGESRSLFLDFSFKYLQSLNILKLSFNLYACLLLPPTRISVMKVFSVLPMSYCCFLFLVVMTILGLSTTPVQSADTLYLCMKNCEQCKSMYGAYFEVRITTFPLHYVSYKVISINVTTSLFSHFLRYTG